MVRGVVATLGMMAVCGLATRWIKVSLHMAFAALAGTALVLMRAPVGYALLLRCRRSRGRDSPCTGTRRSKSRSGRSSAPARRRRFITCDWQARSHSARRPGGRGGVSGGRRAKPRASSSLGPGPGTPDAYRDYLSKHQDARGAAFFVWLEEPRGLVGVVNLSEIVLRMAFGAPTSAITRSCPMRAVA